MLLLSYDVREKLERFLVGLVLVKDRPVDVLGPPIVVYPTLEELKKDFL